MQSRVITRFAELQDLASEWERLWSSNPHRQIFNRFCWSRAWWQGYGSAVGLFAPVASEGGKLRGVLPLVRYNNRLVFFGDPGSDYNDILCDDCANPEILQSLLCALRDASRNTWKSATFTNVPRRSVLLSSIAQLSKPWRTQFVVVEGQQCSSVTLNDEDRETTLQTILGQKEPRQHEKKLQKLGKLSFRHIEDRAEIHSHLPQFFEQHTQRWALVDGGNQRFLSEQSRAFYRALVENLDPCGELRFSVLQLDERPIAYHLGFQLDGKFIHYKPTFDINLWEHSPGQVLTRNLFSYAKDSGVKEFDFTIGNETYKTSLANHTDRNFTIRLFRSGLASSLDRKVFSVRQQLAKDHPPAYVFLKAASGRVVSACRSIRPAGLRKLFGEVARTTARACYPVRERVLLFSLERGEEVRPRLKETPTAGLHLDFTAAKLGALANHSVNHPELLDPTKLQCARARLKKGDIPYLTQIEGRLASLAWIGKRNGLTRADVGLDCDIPFEKSAAVIYDLWIAPNLRKQITANVLHALVSLIHKQGLDAWICCRSKEVSLHRFIEDAGFLMRYQVQQSRHLAPNPPALEPAITSRQETAGNVRPGVGLVQS